ncbi:MAG TPA: ABC transporter substrate-binding protein [Candidatus Limnocylindrales bacterium]|nr:ABC transporter substrate-binding protein [Candidatus Limnocylindrales bacterium]
MHSSPRARFGRTAAAALFVVAALLPSAAPVTAADPVVLTVGTTQDLDASNPFNTALVSGYEVFQMTYDLLVEFDKDTHPAPGFADSWVRAPDKVTFHIRDGMQFSDGTPATSADVCYSWGLAMDAIKNDTNIGYGYLDPNIKDAGVTKIECPDASTFIAYTTDQSDRIFQVYMPILPKHIWSKYDYKTIADQKFDGPLVGTGPYTLVEWKTGQFTRFVRNPHYWGNKGFEDEVVIRFFPDQADVMVQALKSGELDYAHDVNPDQFKALAADPAYTAVAGKANGWSQLAFNTYGTGTGKTIKDGGPSTQALLDPAFRDALGYAVDHQALVDRVLGGYGDVGTTMVPPILKDWHVEPDHLRTFNIDTAKQKLDAAGYVLDGSGKRLDKQGKPIVLRLIHPNSNDSYGKSAQFVKEWYGQLGIDVNVESLDSDTVTNRVLPPPDGKADYDIELWGWSGNPDPNGLTIVFRCDQIDNLSDSQYCNPDYDKLYDDNSTQSGQERHDTLAKMQNLIYDEAPYDILYYDANLDVYRNDRFAGWQTMPADGTPFFTYSDVNYTLLTDATVQPSPSPAESTAASAGSSSAPTAAPSSSTTPDSSNTSSNSTPLLIVAVLAVLVVIGGLLFNRRRRSSSVEDE